MSQTTELLDLFRRNGNTLTLGQILKTTLAAEYRARISEIRKGLKYIVVFHKGKIPSMNTYTLMEVKNGQVEFAA